MFLVPLNSFFEDKTNQTTYILSGQQHASSREFGGLHSCPLDPAIKDQATKLGCCPVLEPSSTQSGPSPCLYIAAVE